MSTRKIPLSEALVEVSSGVGVAWSNYRVLGATRAGLALAKESVGKSPERYKLVEPGTIFYNPMRIMIGSIAMVDDGEEPGITSPDYVVFRPRPGVLHHRWFYYWLRSKFGEDLIRSLARGAVRERLLFNRLSKGEIQVPSWESQIGIAEGLKFAGRAATASFCQVGAIKELEQAYIERIFGSADAQHWGKKSFGNLAYFKNGVNFSASQRGAGTLIVDVLNMYGENLGVQTGNLYRVSVAVREEYVLRPGDILIVRSSVKQEGVAWPAMFEGGPEPVTFCGFLIRARLTDPEMDPRFLTLFLRWSNVRKALVAASGRGTITNISQEKLHSLPIPTPRLSVQKTIVERFDREFALLGRLRRAVGEQEILFRSLHSSLLRYSSNGVT
jgi:restriction endonuclease S subunit